MTDIDKYYKYNCFDLPIPYKQLLFYPVRMTEYPDFLGYSQCLTLDKNSVPDVRVISMSYWDYLCFVSTNEHPLYVWFRDLLRICLKNPELEMNIDNDGKNYYFELDVGEKYFDKDENGIEVGEEKRKYIRFFNQDFEFIKEIIVSQNDVDMPDFTISKELRDEMDRQREFRKKISNTKPCDLEDLLVCISTATSIDPEKLYQMTIRKFNKMVRRVGEYTDYKIYKTAAMSGMVSFKDKNFPPHWMRELEKDKFDGLAMEFDSLKNQISADGKINMG
jgi:hypothetical protein